MKILVLVSVILELVQLYIAFWVGVYLGERGKLRAWWPWRRSKVVTMPKPDR